MGNVYNIEKYSFILELTTVRKYFFFILFLLIQLPVFSEQISGFVYRDSSKTPLEFAIVSLGMENDSLQQVVTTDAAGLYKFKEVKAGAYFIKASFSGFENYVSPLLKVDSLKISHDIFLQATAEQTNAIVIQKKKSIITQEAGKTTVDVKSMSATTGLMALDLLRKMPGVQVDNDGNISLKGKANVSIMLDGKMTNMSAKQISSILRSMLASEIDNIEIITAPSAKYDAQGDGGMININLKKSSKKGFYGDFQATYGQGILPKSNGGVSLFYNSGKWKLHASYNIMANKEWTYGYNDRNFGALSSGLTYLQTYTNVSPGLNHSYSLGADCKVNSKLSFGFSHHGTLMSSAWNSYVDGVVDSSGQVQQVFTTADLGVWRGNSFSSNADFNYKLDSTGSFSGSVNMMNYEDRGDQNMSVSRNSWNVSDMAILKSVTITHNNIFSAKVDYEKSFFKKLQIESGLKWMLNNIDNSVDYSITQPVIVVPASSSKTLFNYREQVSAAYFQAKWAEKKWQYKGGVRSEYWNAKGKEQLTGNAFTRNYLQFFPSAYLSYNPSENHSWSFSYNRRIRRPNSHMLTPVSYFDDPYYLYSGNPKLLPQLSHSVELSHSFKGGGLITTLNYMHSDNYIQQWSVSQRDSSNIMDMTTINIPLYENMGLSVSYYQPVKKWWTAQLYVNVYQNHLAGYLSNSKVTVDNRYISASFYTSHVFTLPKTWTIELTGNYTMKQLVGYTINNPIGSVGLSVKKDIAGGRGTLKLNCQDLFFTFKYSGFTSYQGLERTYLYSWDNRVVYLSFNWKLGSKWFVEKEESKKKVEAIESGR